MKDLVLLHSLLTDRSAFDGVKGALARDFRLHVPDLPGYGGCPSHGEDSIAAYADRVAPDIPQGAAVLGNGFGGFVAVALAIRHGAFWLATNLDATVPSPRGSLPGNGALVAALRHALGRPPAAATGKPDPSMHAESVERSGAKAPIVVGDRLDTDIEGATRVGCPSLLVLTGVTTPSALLAAPPQHRPSYLGRDLAALLQPHPAVAVGDDGAVRCGTASVRTEGEELVLAGATDVLDGLRALAMASWLAADADRRIGGFRGQDEKSNKALQSFELSG